MLLSVEDVPTAIGYVQEIEGGWVYEIANGWLTRRIHCVGGRIGTTSLVQELNGEEYLEETIEEFALVLSKGKQRAEIDYREFEYKSHSTLKWDEDERLLEINLEAEFEGQKLPVSVFYQALSGKNYLRKWIKVHPVPLDWTVEWITLENMRLKDLVEGVTPLQRYPERFPNGEDNVHIEPVKASTDDSGKRFSYADASRAVLAYWGFGEGLFFFTDSLTGQESFHQPRGLLMRQMESVPLSEGCTTGSATIGGYAGPPEIGFKRYIEYLLENWCVVNGKEIPVAWDTWLVTQEDDKPIFSNYNHNLLSEYIDLLDDAGFYDVLLLDLGWEGVKYLQPDPGKFPKGLSALVRRAKEADLDMAFWINPFSASYWKSDFEEEHPEWQTPDTKSPRSGAHPLCVLTPYYQYVEKHLVELVTNMNVRLLYWDGGDWNIPKCSADDHEHSSQHDLLVTGTKKLALLCQKIHEARPDSIIAAFNLPFDNHRLSALDQENISDNPSHPLMQSLLIQRQQIYQMTWEHPFQAIRSGWYGINWHETGRETLKRPHRELIHAEMSMIGSGIKPAGGSFDLKQASPQFIDFMKKLFAWRKRFDNYFSVYQHVLGFPDGENIDGEAHIIDDKGFIILINPSERAQSITLPLQEPELELRDREKYKLFDWSGLEHGRPIGTAKIDSAPELELTALEVKIIGINVSDQ